jgi:hypothetical protein
MGSGSERVTVILRKSSVVGRVAVDKVRADGSRGLPDDVPVSMLRALCEQWTAMGWSVVDERPGASSGYDSPARS